MFLHPLDAVEVILPEPFRAHSCDVPPDIGALLGLAWLEIDLGDACLLSPCLQPTIDVLEISVGILHSYMNGW